MFILSHLATELFARAPWGCLKLIKSCSPSTPGALSPSVASKYALRHRTTFNFGSASYCTNLTTRGPLPNFLPFVSSAMWNSISSPLSSMLDILSLCSSDALLADVKAMSIQTFSDRSRKLKSSSIGCCALIWSSTTAASQVSIYFGCGCFSLNMPFSSFTIMACCPTGSPCTRLCLAEMADLYTFIVRYASPDWNFSVRKFATSSTGAWTGYSCQNSHQPTHSSQGWL